jgi:hypothetical protein
MLLPGSMDTQDAGLKARRVAVDIPSAAEAESIRCHFAAWLKPCPDVLLPSIWRTGFAGPRKAVKTVTIFQFPAAKFSVTQPQHFGIRLVSHVGALLCFLAAHSSGSSRCRSRRLDASPGKTRPLLP